LVGEGGDVGDLFDGKTLQFRRARATSAVRSAIARPSRRSLPLPRSMKQLTRVAIRAPYTANC